MQAIPSTWFELLRSSWRGRTSWSDTSNKRQPQVIWRTHRSIRHLEQTTASSDLENAQVDQEPQSKRKTHPCQHSIAIKYTRNEVSEKYPASQTVIWKNNITVSEYFERSKTVKMWCWLFLSIMLRIWASWMSSKNSRTKIVRIELSLY